MARRMGLVAEANFEALAANPYPGRGIVMGLGKTGANALQVYWVMGRDDDSRNCLLTRRDAVVRTAAFDESKVDPMQRNSPFYNAMDSFGNTHVVTSGEQTVAIMHGLREKNRSFADTVVNYHPEEDKPHYTPRISGALYIGSRLQFEYSIIKRGESDKQVERPFYTGDLSTYGEDGLGVCAHTYKGDGDPLPSFDQEPYLVPLGEDMQDTARLFWDALNPADRVGIAVKQFNLQSHEVDFHIINALEAA